jgi:hypothetical protein
VPDAQTPLITLSVPGQVHCESVACCAIPPVLPRVVVPVAVVPEPPGALKVTVGAVE